MVISPSEKLLLSLNERATDLKFFTAGDNVEEYQRRLFADQLRFEQYQATLFAWMNGEIGNCDDLNIDNLRELFQPAQSHCNRCFESIMTNRGLKFSSIPDQVHEEVGFLKWKCSTCTRITDNANWY